MSASIGFATPGVRIALASVMVVTFALGSAWLTPRGPATPSQALLTVASSLVVGLVVGAATGHRWALLIAPVAVMTIFEIGRMGAWGPTVDAPASLGLLHVLTFLLGCGPNLVLAGARPLGLGGWIAAGALTVALGAVGIVAARPATTAPILGSDGRPIPGSIAELTTVPIGGHPQARMIRGRSSYREAGDTTMVLQLEAAPPTPTGPLPAPYLALRDGAMQGLGVGTTRDMHSVVTGVFVPSWLSRSYTLREKVNLWRGKVFSSGLLRERMFATDLTREVTALDLPVYFFHGRHDYTVSEDVLGRTAGASERVLHLRGLGPQPSVRGARALSTVPPRSHAQRRERPG